MSFDHILASKPHRKKKLKMLTYPNIDPEIFSISLFGLDLSLRWYAVSYIAGFIAAISIMKFYIRRSYLWISENAPMSEEQADSFLTYLVLGVILGGRAGYVLFYNFDYYYANPVESFQVWDGGMSFHGGFLGVIIASVLFFWYNSINILSGADMVALATPPGLLFGRLANFINNELWGKPTEMPWGVAFPGDAAQNCSGVSEICYRHPSQLYEAGLEGLFLFLFLILLSFRGALRTPGVITGVFVAGYGLSRFLVEFFRVADPQFYSVENPQGFALVYGELGLTMGQVLSVPMILIGLILISFTKKIK